MVGSIVNVAKVLELETVAEKVEDGDAEELLRRMGVDYVQGFHVGRPQPIRQLEEPAGRLARTA
jgi:Amt family ammonium transporter